MNRNKKQILMLVVLFGTLTASAYAGGGSTGVHYLCGSRSLNLSFQLDNRPLSRHFKKGTQVLVHEPIFKSSFFVVTQFQEGSELTTLAMKSPDTSRPRDITVEWLGNSIIDTACNDIQYTVGRSVMTDKCATIEEPGLPLVTAVDISDTSQIQLGLQPLSQGSSRRRQTKLPTCTRIGTSNSPSPTRSSAPSK